MTAFATPILVLGVALGSVGCGASNSQSESPGSSTPASGAVRARAQRANLLAVSRGLSAIEAPVAREVAAARRVWPSVVHGVPSNVTPALRGAIAVASARTARISTPAFIAEAGQLTGPAAALAGLLQSFENLLRPCWAHVAASAASAAGDPRYNAAAASFLRANAALYIGCVYDAHYNLSSIGEGLLSAYEQLGGAAAFGRALPPAQLHAIARAYAPSAVRLQPKPSEGR